MSTLVAFLPSISSGKQTLKPTRREITMNPLNYSNRIQIALPPITSMLIALTIFIAMPANATDSCDVVSENLLDPVESAFFPAGFLKLICNEVRDFGWKFKMDVKGDSDLFVTKHTYQPGGQTGWHTHSGPSLITVIKGTLTVYHDDCTSETFTAGQSFTDLGCGDIHNAVNEGATEAIDVAVQIVPHGQLRRTDVEDPGCPNVPSCP